MRSASPATRSPLAASKTEMLPGRVAGRRHDLQVEDVVAVLDRGQRPRDGDVRDVLRARVRDGVGRRLEDVRRAADVVAVADG